MDELIISIISGLVGSIITYILAILKLRKELEIKYDMICVIRESRSIKNCGSC